MRIYIDCEFNGYHGELLSMALVAADGREFYRALTPTEEIQPWVKEHVMPVMQIAPCDTDEFIRCLRAYLWQFESIELVADWPDDLKYFYDCLVTGPGVAINTPRITATVDPRMHSKDSAVPHNALHDARAIRNLGSSL